MNAKQTIQKAVTQTYGDGSPNVYKGTDYDGVQQTGWWYRQFNSTPIFLGKSKNDALEMLAQIEEARVDG